jgi:hypothetical protein
MRTKSYAQLEGSEREDNKICPISELIEISAPFAGIEPEDLRDNENFCRFPVPEYHTRNSQWSSNRYRRDGKINHCEIIHDTISQRVDLVEEVFTYGDLLSIEDIYQLPTSEDEKLVLFTELKGKREKHTEARRILDEWKEIVYEILGDDGESEVNTHFSGYTWEELTDEAVVDEVKKFNRALRNQMLGHTQEESCALDSSGMGAIFRMLRENR